MPPFYGPSLWSQFFVGFIPPTSTMVAVCSMNGGRNFILQSLKTSNCYPMKSPINHHWITLFWDDSPFISKKIVIDIIYIYIYPPSFNDQGTANDHPKLHTCTAIGPIRVMEGTQQFPFVQPDWAVNVAEPAGSPVPPWLMNRIYVILYIYSGWYVDIYIYMYVIVYLCPEEYIYTYIYIYIVVDIYVIVYL